MPAAVSRAPAPSQVAQQVLQVRRLIRGRHPGPGRRSTQLRRLQVALPRQVQGPRPILADFRRHRITQARRTMDPGRALLARPLEALRNSLDDPVLPVHRSFLMVLETRTFLHPRNLLDRSMASHLVVRSDQVDIRWEDPWVLAILQ